MISACRRRTICVQRSAAVGLQSKLLKNSMLCQSWVMICRYLVIIQEPRLFRQHWRASRVMCVFAQSPSYHTGNLEILVFWGDYSHFSLFLRISKKVVLWYYSLPCSTRYWTGSCKKPSCTALVLGKYGQIGFVFVSLKHCLLKAAVL